ncbi:MAG: hypothetical protein Q4A71_06190 [Actinomycetaceae bacterium]|nr:hypothetical protein [Actinomycetaceae bacterium]
MFLSYDPDPQQAQHELFVELLKPDYFDPLEFAQKLLQKLLGFIFGVRGLEDGARFIVGVIVVVVLLFVIIGLLLRVRFNKRLRQTTQTAFIIPEKAAAQYRDEAINAASTDPDQAFILGYRYVVAIAKEKDIIRIPQGMTATEFALKLSAQIPNIAAELKWAAALFNRCAYTEDVSATAADSSRVIKIGDTVSEMFK